MSCLDISLRRQGTPMSFEAVLHGNNMEFSASQVGRPMGFSAERRGTVVLATMERIGKPVEFRCGLVCSTSEAFYLNVEPEYIWLLPENDFSEDVVVYANVSWTIE